MTTGQEMEWAYPYNPVTHTRYIHSDIKFLFIPVKYGNLIITSFKLPEQIVC